MQNMGNQKFGALRAPLSSSCGGLEGPLGPYGPSAHSSCLWPPFYCRRCQTKHAQFSVKIGRNYIFWGMFVYFVFLFLLLFYYIINFIFIFFILYILGQVSNFFSIDILTTEIQSFKKIMMATIETCQTKPTKIALEIGPNKRFLGLLA